MAAFYSSHFDREADISSFERDFAPSVIAHCWIGLACFRDVFQLLGNLFWRRAWVSFHVVFGDDCRGENALTSSSCVPCVGKNRVRTRGRFPGISPFKCTLPPRTETARIHRSTLCSDTNPITTIIGSDSNPAFIHT